MRARKVASALLEIARSKESRDTVKEAVKSAIESSSSQRRSAVQASSRARSIVNASRAVLYGAPEKTFEDDVAELWFPEIGEEQILRANEAFFAKLAAEHAWMLTSHDDISSHPALPEDPFELAALRFDPAVAWGLFAEKSSIEDKAVLQLECGAGELGKILAYYAKSYVGIDDSTAALKLAKLVSPRTATYVHPSKHVSLATHHGSIDTVLGSDLFVHRNLEAAKGLLSFVEPFLKDGGKFFAEFYSLGKEPNDDVVYPAPHPNTHEVGSVFAYTRSNLETLIRNRPFEIVLDEERPELERRFVVFKKLRPDY